MLYSLAHVRFTILTIHFSHQYNILAKSRRACKQRLAAHKRLTLEDIGV